MGVFSRSWEITKLSWDVIMKDKELLLFPVLSGIFSLMFILAMVFPSILGPLIFGMAGNAASEIAIYISIFIIYLGLVVIATFFNVCTVHTIKTRFEGGNATFGESIKFAFSRLHLIITWGLLSATIGLIFRVLDRIGEKSGWMGELIMHIVTSILGAVWSLITIFVVPVMVYKGCGPIDAIKASVHTLKKTWGESLIREIGIGLVSMVFWIGGFIFWLAILFLAAPLGIMILIPIALLAVVYFVIVAVVFSLMNSVFNTALYVYAETGKVPAFSKELMSSAFRKKGKAGN
jgi:hypothetical protein